MFKIFRPVFQTPLPQYLRNIWMKLKFEAHVKKVHLEGPGLGLSFPSINARAVNMGRTGLVQSSQRKL